MTGLGKWSKHDFFFFVLTGQVGFYVDLKRFCVYIGVSAIIRKTYIFSMVHIMLNKMDQVILCMR